MSIFDFSVLNLKKTIHFIHFGVRPPNLTRLTFMVWMCTYRGGHVATIMQRFYKIGFKGLKI
jgi:hypothetical protein